MTPPVGGVRNIYIVRQHQNYAWILYAYLGKETNYASSVAAVNLLKMHVYDRSQIHTCKCTKERHNPNPLRNIIATAEVYVYWVTLNLTATEYANPTRGSRARRGCNIRGCVFPAFLSGY